MRFDIFLCLMVGGRGWAARDSNSRPTACKAFNFTTPHKQTSYSIKSFEHFALFTPSAEAALSTVKPASCLVDVRPFTQSLWFSLLGKYVGKYVTHHNYADPAFFYT
jgi:hypothetical protein